MLVLLLILLNFIISSRGLSAFIIAAWSGPAEYELTLRDRWDVAANEVLLHRHIWICYVVEPYVVWAASNLYAISDSSAGYVHTQPLTELREPDVMTHNVSALKPTGEVTLDSIIKTETSGAASKDAIENKDNSEIPPEDKAMIAAHDWVQSLPDDYERSRGDRAMLAAHDWVQSLGTVTPAETLADNRLDYEYFKKDCLVSPLVRDHGPYEFPRAHNTVVTDRDEEVLKVILSHEKNKGTLYPALERSGTVNCINKLVREETVTGIESEELAQHRQDKNNLLAFEKAANKYEIPGALERYREEKSWVVAVEKATFIPQGQDAKSLCDRITISEDLARNDWRYLGEGGSETAEDAEDAFLRDTTVLHNKLVRNPGQFKPPEDPKASTGAERKSS